MALIKLNHKDEDYQDKTTEVEINFISQRMTKEFSSIISDITTLQQLHRLIESAPKHKGEVIANNSREEAKKQIDNIEENLNVARDKYQQLCSIDLYKKRYDLIVKILKANQYEGELLNSEFWEEYVDPSEVNNFMAKCIMKDKKKE